jgi:hypothetical protein
VTPKANAGKEANLSVPVHAYNAIMMEAVHSAYSAHQWRSASSCESDRGDTLSAYECGTNAGIAARYAFCTACIAAEAGANALLRSTPGISTSLYRDLEKLQTLNKYEVFALVHQLPLDRSNDIYGKMKTVVGLRNDFFHPKQAMVELADTESGIREETVSGRILPAALDFLDPRHAIPIVGDILRFISWVVFDTCKLSLKDGAEALSPRVSGSYTAVISQAHEELGYDIRSFGRTE